MNRLVPETKLRGPKEGKEKQLKRYAVETELIMPKDVKRKGRIYE